MVILVIVLVLALLAVWIVRTAGWRFAVQRLGGALLILVVVTFGTTVLLRQVGVDEQQERALEELGLPASSQPCVASLGTSAADLDLVRECVDDRGLDKSVFEQYGKWLGQVMSGDLGYSFTKNKELLSDELTTRGPRSLFLFLYSQAIALAIAVPLGVWSAYQAGRKGRGLPGWGLPVLCALLAVLLITTGRSADLVIVFAILVPIAIYNGIRGGPAGDATVNTFAFVLLSIPVFVLAETMRYVFAVRRDWYDLVGYKPWSDGIGAHLGSIWLPALVLGLAISPVYLRLLRADMLQNLQQDFVAVARAKGMSNRHILFRHVLRPSTLTLLTVAGLNIAQLVNGAIVIEFIYSFNGLGSFLLEEVARREFFAIQTIVAIVAALFVLTNTVIDVLYTTVDPRVRVEDEK